MTETFSSKIEIHGAYRFKIYDSETGKFKRETDWHKNLVVYSTNHGLGMIAQQLIGITTYPLEITQLKIGTGTNPVNAANTDLQTTVTSGIIKATQSFTSTSATMEFFIPNAILPNGTYTELGIFCGNQLFARSLISPSFTKATNEDVGVEYIINLSNS